MLETIDLELQFGGRTLFKHADLKFTSGNCYGIIGANGAGKSTFLKILSGDVEATSGHVVKSDTDRMSVLKQDHYAYDDYTVIKCVLMGNQELCDIMDEKEILYAKENMTDEEGIRLCELEDRFMELDGWSAESNAEILLNDLGITGEYHQMLMKDIPGSMKVKVLLAQALFGNPDILLMDEPTNNLDLDTISWLEEYIINLDSIVLVVSHDRYFLNKICTYTVDVDFGKITMLSGNYDFWYSYTQLRQRQIKEQNKKAEQKIKEMQEFISRFSANASKSKQATSRKKILENINIEEMPVSSRKFPYVAFKPDRAIGNELLTVENLTKSYDGRKILDNVSFTLHPGDKVAFVGNDPIAITTLMNILMEQDTADSGSFKWGVTTSRAYIPADNSEFFDGCPDTLVEWIRRHSTLIYESDIRGILGRMLFSGDEVNKKVSVLSGGEKVRCMLCRGMLSGANVMLLDEPTNHLDLESIEELNDALIRFEGSVLFTSADHQFVQTIADRIIDLTPGKFADKQMTYDEYILLNK